MSGHSKFANIKHKKEKNDAAKGKIFTIIGREIAVAVKEGGPDPANNFKLAQVIAKAKASNMPNDTIERGIKKASGDGNAVNYERVTYEGYGPNGIAIIVEALTDNKNRTAANVRSAFTKGNGSIGTQGCVSFMFDKKGLIYGQGHAVYTISDPRAILLRDKAEALAKTVMEKGVVLTVHHKLPKSHSEEAVLTFKAAIEKIGQWQKKWGLISILSLPAESPSKIFGASSQISSIYLFLYRTIFAPKT